MRELNYSDHSTFCTKARTQKIKTLHWLSSRLFNLPGSNLDRQIHTHSILPFE